MSQPPATAYFFFCAPEYEDMLCTCDDRHNPDAAPLAAASYDERHGFEEDGRDDFDDDGFVTDLDDDDDSPPPHHVHFAVTLKDATLDTFDDDARADFARGVAGGLGVAPEKVAVVGASAGSVVVDTRVMTESAAGAAALASVLSEPEVIELVDVERFGGYGVSGVRVVAPPRSAPRRADGVSPSGVNGGRLLAPRRSIEVASEVVTATEDHSLMPAAPATAAAADAAAAATPGGGKLTLPGTALATRIGGGNDAAAMKEAASNAAYVITISHNIIFSISLVSEWGDEGVRPRTTDGGAARDGGARRVSGRVGSA